MDSKIALENISTTERYVRFGLSVAAIVAAMESSVSSGLFAVINFAAIALTTTAIVGWDPLKSSVCHIKSLLSDAAPQRTAVHGR